MTNHTQPHGPKGKLFWGNFVEFNQQTLSFLRNNRQFGDVTKFMFGPFPAYIVNGAEQTHQVLLDSTTSYAKSELTTRLLAPVLGNGLFTSEGDFWKRQRKLMQPAFHAKRIGAYADTMAQYADDMAQRWSARPDQVSPVMVDKDMQALTMRIISKTLFDADVDKEAQEVGEAVTEALAVVEQNFRGLIKLPDWVPTPSNRRMQTVVKRLDALIQGFIDARRKSTTDNGDFLTLLLSAQDEDQTHMTDKQVRDEAMTLFGAGHETTAATMTWAFYMLSQNPDVKAKLIEEVDRVLGSRLPTLADLRDLPYTEQIIKETMRMYPVAYLISRQSAQAVELDGFALPKGSIILVNVLGMHYDPRYFPDPDVFNPDRFSAENEKSIPRYAYIPFGGGPRVCIGNAFAMMEMQIMLAVLAQRFDLQLTPGFAVEPDRQFTLKPKHGLSMIIQPRNRAPVPQPAEAVTFA